MNKLPLLLVPCLAACSGIPTEMPPGKGPGLVTGANQQPPAGAETFPRPKLKRGDRFVFEEGRALKYTMRVTRADATGYEFNQAHEHGQSVAIYDANLGLVEQRRPQAPHMNRMTAPADSTFTWPLWVGKRWTCIFLEKNPMMGTREVAVEYRTDKMETIKVGAGEFRCVRIWRHSQPTRGRFTRDTTIYWYAPEVGFWVRKVDGGITTELIDFERQ